MGVDARWGPDSDYASCHLKGANGMINVGWRKVEHKQRLRTSDRGFTQKGRWGSPDGYVSPGLRRGKRKAPCLASVRYLN